MRIKFKGFHPSRNVLNFKFGTGNIRSLKNKADLKDDHLLSEKFDAFLITEIWLKDTKNDQSWLKASTLNSGNYAVHPINREDKNGGGIALVCNSNLKSKLLSKASTNLMEYGV